MTKEEFEFIRSINLAFMQSNQEQSNFIQKALSNVPDEIKPFYLPVEGEFLNYTEDGDARVLLSFQLPMLDLVQIEYRVLRYGQSIPVKLIRQSNETHLSYKKNILSILGEWVNEIVDPILVEFEVVSYNN